MELLVRPGPASRARRDDGTVAAFIVAARGWWSEAHVSDLLDAAKSKVPSPFPGQELVFARENRRVPERTPLRELADSDGAVWGELRIRACAAALRAEANAQSMAACAVPYDSEEEAELAGGLNLGGSSEKRKRAGPGKGRKKCVFCGFENGARAALCRMCRCPISMRAKAALQSAPAPFAHGRAAPDIHPAGMCS